MPCAFILCSVCIVVLVNERECVAYGYLCSTACMDRNGGRRRTTDFVHDCNAKLIGSRALSVVRTATESAADGIKEREGVRYGKDRVESTTLSARPEADRPTRDGRPESSTAVWHAATAAACFIVSSIVGRRHWPRTVVMTTTSLRQQQLGCTATKQQHPTSACDVVRHPVIPYLLALCYVIQPQVNHVHYNKDPRVGRASHNALNQNWFDARHDAAFMTHVDVRCEWALTLLKLISCFCHATGNA